MLTQEQKERCLGIMDRLLGRAISVMFDHEIDPIAEQMPNYYEIIKNPTNLRKIRQKAKRP